MRFLVFVSVLFGVMSYPTRMCPMKPTDMVFRDMMVMADRVSWDGDTGGFAGFASDYSFVYEKNGKYDTRMRIYGDHSDESRWFIVFRPTQQTDEGGQIHVDRYLSPCEFLNGSCQGMVHHRFQQAFLSLIEDLEVHVPEIREKNLFIVGHSLGGAFAIFMSIYAQHILEITPTSVFGIAGPFIGDDIFSHTYQSSLSEETLWYQIESVNRQNPSEFDGTVEGYNVDHPPLIHIFENAVCGVTVNRLPDSYGMHDLRNYLQFFEPEHRMR